MTKIKFVSIITGLTPYPYYAENLLEGRKYRSA